jgi:DNA-binding MarR family transcriptional regulator
MTAKPSTQIAVSKALQILEVFRGMNQDMPIGEAVSFLLIAAGETRGGGGLTVTELSKLGDFSLAAASRYMRSLASKNRHGEPGHDIITDYRDPIDDRRKVLRVSEKGNVVLQQLADILKK